MPAFISLFSQAMAKSFFIRENGDKLRFTFHGELINTGGEKAIYLGFDDFSTVPINFEGITLTEEPAYFTVDGFMIVSASDTLRIGAEFRCKNSNVVQYNRYSEFGLSFGSSHTFEFYAAGGVALHMGFLEFIPRIRNLE